MKNKLMLIILAMLVVVTLIGGASVLILNFMEKMNQSADPGQNAVNSVQHVGGIKHSAAEVKKLTVPVENVITNLKERGSTIKAGFAFEMSSEKAKKELEDYDSRVRNVINQTLADLTIDELSGSKGQETLKALLMNKINEFLADGNVVQINVTEIIMQ